MVINMNKKELKEYQDKMMSGASGTMKLGVATGVGGYTLGLIGGSVPGAAPGLSAASSALNLANVGNLAAVGMSIMPGQENKANKKSTKEQQALLNKFK